MKDKFGLEDHLPGLVERIVASYNSDERTHHIDKQFLPSRIRIIEAVEMLLELLYPGYWGRQHLTSHNVSYHVGELLPRIGEILHEEIALGPLESLLLSARLIPVRTALAGLAQDQGGDVSARHREVQTAQGNSTAVNAASCGRV